MKPRHYLFFFLIFSPVALDSVIPSPKPHSTPIQLSAKWETRGNIYSRSCGFSNFKLHFEMYETVGRQGGCKFPEPIKPNPSNSFPPIAQSRNYQFAKKLVIFDLSRMNLSEGSKSTVT